MFTKRNILFAVSVLIILLFMQIDANAQCAMCKAVAEDGVKADGTGVASGLNNGIMYIMAIPYLLLAAIGFIFFRKKVGGFLREFNNIH